ncbi:hypothetical protein [Pseudonocardia asaccharolytica]|uniref:hypothetical protein n=1 Tax=Pseudonocardia asaccharolytica TaxID=54010 RepID=UPI0012B5B697|nr:hypothetical protein [Pseudonocardia asaccharolytica]
MTATRGVAAAPAICPVWVIEAETSAAAPPMEAPITRPASRTIPPSTIISQRFPAACR